MYYVEKYIPTKNGLDTISIYWGPLHHHHVIVFCCSWLPVLDWFSGIHTRTVPDRPGWMPSPLLAG